VHGVLGGAQGLRERRRALAVAAEVGGVRLIDNAILTAGEPTT